MRCFLLATLVAECAAAQISVQLSVQNAANSQIQGTVAPGSLAIISATSNNAIIPLPKTLTVEVGGEQAPVISAPGYSVTVLIPANLPTGTTQLSIAGNGAEGTVAVNVLASNFGLFTNSSGAGQALAQNVASGSVMTNNLTNPAHPGDTVTLYGTGLGSATPSQVGVLLGGHSATVTYSGPAPTLPGVDQINFVVPDDPAIPNGCFVAVQVVVNGVATNQASLSTAAAGGTACTPPIDLTLTQMAQLDAGQQVAFVNFLIDGLVSEPTSAGLVRNESFNVETFSTNEAGLALLSQPLLADDVFYSCSASNGAIGVINLLGSGNLIDLGPKLTLTGPGTTGYLLTTGGNFASLSLPTGPPVSSPDYLPPPYFVPGVWQIAGPGSVPTPYTSVENATLAFSAQITTPPTIQLTNYASLQTINPASPALVEWNPSGYGPNDVVTITLSGISCRAHATDGQLSIPATALTPVPGLSAGPPPTPFFQISVAPRPDQIMRTDIPLEGGGVVPGTFRYSFTESFSVLVP